MQCTYNHPITPPIAWRVPSVAVQSPQAFQIKIPDSRPARASWNESGAYAGAGAGAGLGQRDADARRRVVHPRGTKAALLDDSEVWHMLLPMQRRGGGVKGEWGGDALRGWMRMRMRMVLSRRLVCGHWTRECV